MKTAPRASWKVRRSRIHGHGVFALCRIPAGRRIVEYKGERLTAEEADDRYDDKTDGTAHVLLFSLEDGTFIDGGSGGSEARFINHSCDPNCEAVEQDGRIFIESVRAIEPGEEITYDYGLELPGRHTKAVKACYPCRCGSPKCRGTLLVPRRRVS